jgi:hypothetical protein
MARKNIGIIMNGVTGRMGTNQHLVRSILAIREQGGVVVRNGAVLRPSVIDGLWTKGCGWITSFSPQQCAIDSCTGV